MIDPVHITRSCQCNLQIAIFLCLNQAISVICGEIDKKKNEINEWFKMLEDAYDRDIA